MRGRYILTNDGRYVYQEGLGYGYEKTFLEKILEVLVERETLIVLSIAVLIGVILIVYDTGLIQIKMAHPIQEVERVIEYEPPKIACTPKDEIKNVESMVDKYLGYITKNGNHVVSLFTSSLSCVPEKATKIIEWCNYKNLSAGVCIYVVTRSGEGIYNYAFSKTETPPEKVKEPDKQTKKAPPKPAKQAIKNPHKKDEEVSKAPSRPEEDMYKKAKNKCMETAHKASELQELTLENIVLVKEIEKIIYYEWPINKEQKVSCTSHVDGNLAIIKLPE